MTLQKRPLTEQKVLKKLGITKFSEVTKDMTMNLASMLPEMDPEVAKKVIEQFPRYAETVRSLADIYMSEVSRFADSNDQSEKECYSIIKGICAVIQEELSNPNLTHEQRMELNGQLIKAGELAMSLDKQGKEFKKQIVETMKQTVVAFGMMCLIPIGTKIIKEAVKAVV